MIKWMEELVKYGFAGGVSTIANLILFWLLEKMGLYYILANILSYIAAVILNYILNERYVFEHKDKTDKREEKKRLIKFIFIRAVNLLADNILFYLCVNRIGISLYFSRFGLTFAEIIVTYGMVKILVFQGGKNECI